MDRTSGATSYFTATGAGCERGTAVHFRFVRKAVIDVGSNSVLLTVAESLAGGWAPTLETSEVTALGEGVRQTGRLSEVAIGRTLAAIARAFDAARQQGAEEVIAAATMAARIAENRQEFLDRAQHQGTPVFVLSGEEEARLGFLSAADDPLVAGETVLTTLDVGGHSTEIATHRRTKEGWESQFSESFPIGTLSLRGSSMADEAPDGLARLRAVAELDRVFAFCHLPGKAGTVVALGAAGTNLVSLREKLDVWDPNRVHGATLDYEEISRSVGYLCEMTDDERRVLPGLEPGRERTIHLGALVLERGLYALRSAKCTVSVRGWRHSLLERGLLDLRS